MKQTAKLSLGFLWAGYIDSNSNAAPGNRKYQIMTSSIFYAAHGTKLSDMLLIHKLCEACEGVDTDYNVAIQVMKR